MISSLLHFNKKLKSKKEKYTVEFKYLLFLREKMNDLFGVKDV